MELPYADMITALANKAIDVGFINEPSAQAAVEKAGAVKWKSAPDVAGKYMAALVQVGPKLLGKKDVVTRFWKAYVQGCRDYYEDFFLKKNRQAIVDLLIKNTTIKDPASYDKMGANLIDPNADIEMASIDEQLAWFKAAGMDVPAKNKMIDDSARQEALKQMGRYNWTAPTQ